MSCGAAGAGAAAVVGGGGSAIPVAVPGRSRERALEVVRACALLLPVHSPVLDDQIDDLLRAQPGVHPEVSEGEIVPALALVFKVMALPEPSVPEPHVYIGPALDQLLWKLRLQIDDDR